MQNIDGSNEDIRPQFIAGEGRVFVGSDFSSQEPRILTQVSQDQALLDNFRQERDIYATLYEIATDSPYEDNLEFDANGEYNAEGKKRRNVGKILQLALTYGMGAEAVGDITKLGLEEAKELVQRFKDNLPGVMKYEAELKEFASKHGYVETIYGTKCRFPNYALPEITVTSTNGTAVHPDIKRSINKAYEGVWKYLEREDLRKQLSAQYNVNITDNTLKIKEEETRILNAVIQGSAACQTKRAMILIDECEVLHSIDAHLDLAVHDELILSCPKEHVELASKMLAEHMVAAAKEKVTSIPFSVDVEVMERWGESK